MKVFFTGISGSGKSKVAKLLAKELGVKFVDTDRLIEKKAGVPIADIFKNRGERQFRQLEKEVVIEVAHAKGDSCVALGGGAVTIKEVRDALKKKQLSGCECLRRRLASV